MAGFDVGLVFRYFQTKEQLVTDRDRQVQDELCRRIRARAPGTTPTAAIRDFACRAEAVLVR
jgi:AcrR family transcriptional regulator